MYDRITVNKHNVPVAEFERLQPVMKEYRTPNNGNGKTYHEGHIEIRAHDNILVIQLFSEDINDE